MKPLYLLPVLLGGCWKTDRVRFPEGVVSFEPAAGFGGDWVVSEATLDLTCPDGTDTRMLFVHPRESNGPRSTAVLFHSGSFDFVSEPDPADPLAGNHLKTPSRLEVPWAVRMGYATLGMVPSPLSGEDHQGELPAALARSGVAMVLPLNCWGDWWHNEQGANDNDFETDRFFRSGRVVGEWGVRSVVDPSFREAIGLTLPFEPDLDAVFLVGLGEGARGVAEVLHLDDDADGVGDYSASAVVLDSPTDDLAPLADQRPSSALGLERIFGDELAAGQYATLEQPPPTMLIRSPSDVEVPEGSNDRLLSNVDQTLEAAAARHVLSNADAEIAAAAVEFLLDER